MNEECVVRVRGLPWSASAEEVVNFLDDVNILGGVNGVHFTFVRDGRPSGEAYIELETEADVDKCLAKNKANMGKRYIEVFRSKRGEMEWMVKRTGSSGNTNEAVVRLRGLPYGCSKEEIAHFFSGLEIVPNGITLIQDHQGRTTGDAYVQFASQDLAERAQEKHKEKIGHRYIEIFKSSLAEARQAMAPRGRGGMGGRPGPYDRMERGLGMGMGGGGGGGGGMGGGMGQQYGRGGRARGNIKGFYDDFYDDFGGGYGGGGNQGRFGGRGGSGGRGMSGGMGNRRGGGMGGMGGRGMSNSRDGANYQSQTGHCVHMRGLPFAANEQDILDFFAPLNPVNVFVHFNDDGRASGEADVDFATHEEAQEAMGKDKASMQHRYIELFLKSTPGGRQSNFGNNSNMGMGGGSGNNMMGNSGNMMGGNSGGMGFNQNRSNFGGRGDGGNFGGGGGYGNSGGMGGGNFSNNMGGMDNNMGNPNYTAF